MRIFDDLHHVRTARLQDNHPAYWAQLEADRAARVAAKAERVRRERWAALWGLLGLLAVVFVWSH